MSLFVFCHAVSVQSQVNIADESVERRGSQGNPGKLVLECGYSEAITLSATSLGFNETGPGRSFLTPAISAYDRG